MPTRKLQRNEWQHYFDQASRRLPAASVDVEVSGLDLGAQVEAEHLPLEGFSYDPKDDAFYIICEGLKHKIHHPRSISVRQQGQSLKAVEVIDNDDHHHVVTLTAALELPEGRGEAGAGRR